MKPQYLDSFWLLPPMNKQNSKVQFWRTLNVIDVRMATFVLKIEKLSQIIAARGSQDLRSPSPIMAPDKVNFLAFPLVNLFFNLAQL